jgi:hypothetical protein
MTTLEFIIVILAFLLLAIIAATVMLWPKKPIIIPELLDEEKHVVSVCHLVMDVKTPNHITYVVRYPTHKITAYYGLTWSQIEKEFDVWAKGLAFVKQRLILIRRYDDCASLDTFTRLYIHELLHLQGYDHGAEMDSVEINYTEKILKILNEHGKTRT